MLAQRLEVPPALLQAAAQNVGSVSGPDGAEWAAALAALPAFAGMQADLLHGMLRAMTLRVVHPGTSVEQAAAPVDCLYIVVSGSLELAGALDSDGVLGSASHRGGGGGTQHTEQDSGGTSSALSTAGRSSAEEHVPAGWALGGSHFADTEPSPAAVRVPLRARAPTLLLALTRTDYMACMWRWGAQTLLGSRFGSVLRSECGRGLPAAAQHLGLARMQAGTVLCAEGSVCVAAAVSVQGEAAVCCYEPSAADTSDVAATAAEALGQQQVAASGLHWLAQVSSGDVIGGVAALHCLCAAEDKTRETCSSATRPDEYSAGEVVDDLTVCAAPEAASHAAVCHSTSVVMATPGWALVADVAVLTADVRRTAGHVATPAAPAEATVRQLDSGDRASVRRCLCRPSGMRPAADVDAASRLLGAAGSLRCALRMEWHFFFTEWVFPDDCRSGALSHSRRDTLCFAFSSAALVADRMQPCRCMAFVLRRRLVQHATLIRLSPGHKLPTSSCDTHFWVVDGSLEPLRQSPRTRQFCSVFDDVDASRDGDCTPPMTSDDGEATATPADPRSRLLASSDAVSNGSGTAGAERTAVADLQGPGPAPCPVAAPSPDISGRTAESEAATPTSANMQSSTLRRGASLHVPAADPASSNLRAGPEGATLLSLAHPAWAALQQLGVHALPSEAALRVLLPDSCREASVEWCAALLHGSVVQRFEAGEQLLLAGERTDTALLLLSGALRLRYEPADAAGGCAGVLARDVHAGTFVAAVAALRRQALWASVSVVADAAVLVVPSDSLQAATQLPTVAVASHSLLDIIWGQEMNAREAAISALARARSSTVAPRMSGGLAILVDRVASGSLSASEAVVEAPFAPQPSAVRGTHDAAAYAPQQRWALAQAQAHSNSAVPAAELPLTRRLQASLDVRRPADHAASSSTGRRAEQQQQQREAPPVPGSLMRQYRGAVADLADGKRRILQAYDGASITLGDRGELRLQVPYIAEGPAGGVPNCSSSLESGDAPQPAAVDLASLRAHGRWQAPSHDALDRYFWDARDPAARCAAQLRLPSLAVVSTDAPDYRAYYRALETPQSLRGEAEEAASSLTCPRAAQTWAGMWRAAKVRLAHGLALCMRSRCATQGHSAAPCTTCSVVCGVTEGRVQVAALFGTGRVRSGMQATADRAAAALERLAVASVTHSVLRSARALKALAVAQKGHPTDVSAGRTKVKVHSAAAPDPIRCCLARSSDGLHALQSPSATNLYIKRSARAATDAGRLCRQARRPRGCLQRRAEPAMAARPPCCTGAGHCTHSAGVHGQAGPQLGFGPH